MFLKIYLKVLIAFTYAQYLSFKSRNIEKKKNELKNIVVCLSLGLRFSKKQIKLIN